MSGIDQIPTPALVIDAPVVEANVRRMAEYCAGHGLGLRPHTKTHKSRKLAAMQLAAGAIGLTVAKVGEAEVLAGEFLDDEFLDHGGSDILLAYPAVDWPRASRLAQLARSNIVRVAIDSATAARTLSEAAQSAGTSLGILVDLDVGFGRTGVQSPQAALELAEWVMATRILRLDGIMCYPGHIGQPASEQGPLLAQVADLLAETIALWTARGLPAEIVSGGSTPTAFQSHLVEQLTEIRPGTYIFNDMNTVRGGFCTLADCAARIVATVVSTAVPGQVVIDAGSKTLTSDRCVPAPDSGHGYVVEYPDARIAKLSEEHGQVDIHACPRVPGIGERITIVPNHICPCINLQDSVWWRTAEGMLEPLSIDARGRLS